ncbi:hypothetical protein OUZ56_033663 [Daphnia magna]|uniref:Uncharacterized protein n=1 Tax=Daphnia magna TaxID=35525 RepID=A0ABR0BAZ4_9CRUS|nr:hypothetical protein OUZ56_033663 [Daphnia magna]
MAENPPPSAASVKEKLKKSREREVECASNLQLLQKDLLKARTAAIDVVLTHQKNVVKLDEELEENAEDLKNVHVHFLSERETLLSSYVGSLLRKESKKAASKPVSQPDAPRFVAPQHTPSILCFLRTYLGKPEVPLRDRRVILAYRLLTATLPEMSGSLVSRYFSRCAEAEAVWGFRESSTQLAYAPQTVGVRSHSTGHVTGD